MITLESRLRGLEEKPPTKQTGTCGAEQLL